MHQFTTRARIESESDFVQTQNAYYTTIREPSPDNFTTGSSYRVRSTGPLGQVGTQVDCKIQITNYTRTERFTDKQTRQPREITKNNVNYEVLHYQAAVDIKPTNNQKTA